MAKNSIQADALVVMGVSGDDRVVSAVNRVGNSFEQNARRVDKTTQAMKQQFRFMRGGLGQLGYQIQDVAVQLQMGQNAMLVFGQQGSQVASLFGPQGAVLGAILAVGAAIATTFVNRTKEGTDGLKDLAEEARSFASEFGLANDAIRAFLVTAESAKYNEVIGEQIAYSKQIAETEARLEDLHGQQRALNGQSATVGQALRANKKSHEEVAAEILRTENALIPLNAQMALATMRVDEQREAYFELLRGGNPYAKVEEGAASADNTVTEYIATLRSSVQAITMTKDEIGLLQAQQAGATETQLRYIRAMQLNIRNHAELDEVIQRLQRTQDSNRAAVDNMIGALERQVMAQTMSARQLALYDAANRNATEGDIARINALYDQIEAWNGLTDAVAGFSATASNVTFPEAEAEALDARDQFKALEASLGTEIDMIRHAEEQKQKMLTKFRDDGIIDFQEYVDVKKKIADEANRLEKEALLNMAAQYTASIGSQLEQLSEFVGQTSAIGKTLFAISKAIAVGNAIINAHVAYSTALATIPPPFNIPVANTMLALGYANAAAITGQAIAGFEGGGMTPNGARSGGLDGKGGMLAVLHPNEKVTDMEKGGRAEPVNVSFNIQANDAKGFDELLMRRRGMIVSMVNRAMNERGKRGVAQ